MSTTDHRPRPGRRLRAAALLCGSLVFAATLAMALVGGGRGWGERPGQPQDNSTTPIAANLEGAVPASAAAVGVDAPVIQPIPTSSALVAPPASKPVAAAKAAALVGASTQDALSALTAAAATAARGSPGKADKQQEQAQAQAQEQSGGGTCRVETAEELADAVKVFRCVQLDRIIPHSIITKSDPKCGWTYRTGPVPSSC